MCAARNSPQHLKNCDSHVNPGKCTPFCARSFATRYLAVSQKHLYAFGNVSIQALYTLPREVDTNQRIGFDIDPTGRYVATGSTERRALVYDIESRALVGSLENQPDAVGSVCFHPHAAIVGVCTGQRHFDFDTDTGSDDDVSEEDISPVRGLISPTTWQNGVTIHGIGTVGSNGTR